MSTSRKKPLLFAVIVVVGTVLVLLDVPLILLVPLLVLARRDPGSASGTKTCPSRPGRHRAS